MGFGDWSTYHHGYEESHRLERGVGIYRGYNLTTGDPKLRFAGADADADLDSEVEATWALPLNNTPELEAHLDNLAKAFQLLENTRAVIHELLEKLQPYRLDLNQGKRDAAERETEVRALLEGDDPGRRGAKAEGEGASS